MKIKASFTINTRATDSEIKETLMDELCFTKGEAVFVWSPIYIIGDILNGCGSETYDGPHIAYIDVDLDECFGDVDHIMDVLDRFDETCDRYEAKEHKSFYLFDDLIIEKPKTPDMTYTFDEDPNHGEYELHLKTDCHDDYDTIRSIIESIAESYNGG